MNADLTAAYNATGRAWQVGAGPVYDRLADVVVGQCPVPLAGARVLDLGAGTGAAWRAARRRGANVVAVDIAVGMLTAAARRPPSVAGDAVALPFLPGSFDAVIAAFSLNHLARPVAGLREAVRVLAAGGGLVVSAYSADDHHPVKAATDAAAAARGWRPEPWYLALRERAVPRLATVERAGQVAAEAGLDGADLRTVRVSFPELGARDLVAWRLGMAQLAPFVAGLPRQARAALVRDALGRLGPEPPVLVRSLVVLRWRDGRRPSRDVTGCAQPSTRDANARTASPSGASAATATARRSASARQVALPNSAASPATSGQPSRAAQWPSSPTTASSRPRSLAGWPPASAPTAVASRA
ncbi:MAG TPA: class I SAM-dependent methyltransferase [Mycobacteriales bacterium]|nr:class I SAM-dependent methyltransferase [Mycobacteriales bacterium]